MGQPVKFITRKLDHLGLVAGMVRQLGIVKSIDDLLGSKSVVTKNVSVGECVAAMIINGLGFANQALYLVPRFFANKPVNRLIGSHLTPEDLNDDNLGRSLDRIADVDPTLFFAHVAFPIAMNRKLRRAFGRLDSTTLSLEGSYDGFGDSPDEAPQLISIARGHSKQHRPDLKQIVLSIANTGPCGMPFWNEPLSGNSSDKSSFHNTIARIRSFQKSLKDPEEFCWVADSALYSKEHLLRSGEKMLWLTRVPETIKEARELVESADVKWLELESGYKIAAYHSGYGGMAQRWLLVFSPEAHHREIETLNKNLEKEFKAMEKALWHLSSEEFACEADCQKRFTEVSLQYKYHTAVCQIKQVARHAQRGRPAINAAPEAYVFKIDGVQVLKNSSVIEKEQNRKGKFILATNDLAQDKLSDQDMLKEYKDLSKVERGFRFLKDPRFMLDKLFLKTPNRIAALTAIMTLCLMVYNIAEYDLRQKLVTMGATLPNQLKKQIQNPTLRWIFQLMDGIAEVSTSTGKKQQAVISNIDDVAEKIINFFGKEVQEIYGLTSQFA